MKKVLRLTTYPVLSTNGANLSQLERLLEITKTSEVEVVSLVSIKNFELFKKLAYNWSNRFKSVTECENKLTFFLTI